MSDATLSPTGLVQIEVGASEDSWGLKLNDNFALINTLLTGLATGVQNFTPVLTATTPPTGVTYTTQTGRYMQIGKLVVATVQLEASSLGSGGSGTVRISGLPASAVVLASASVATADYTTGLVAGEIVTALIPSSSAYVELRRRSTNNSAALAWSALAAGFTLHLTVAYLTT